jgi:hypothetical protein
MLFSAARYLVGAGFVGQHRAPWGGAGSRSSKPEHKRAPFPCSQYLELGKLTHTLNGCMVLGTDDVRQNPGISASYPEDSEYVPSVISLVALACFQVCLVDYKLPVLVHRRTRQGRLL